MSIKDEKVVKECSAWLEFRICVATLPKKDVLSTDNTFWKQSIWYRRKRTFKGIPHQPMLDCRTAIENGLMNFALDYNYYTLLSI